VVAVLKNVPKFKSHSLQHPKVSKHIPKITKPQKQDVFAVYDKSIEKYFNTAKKTTATYLQSVTDLQEKIIESWKKSMDSTVSLQQEFAQKSKMNTKVPDETVKVINDIAELANKSQALENKMLMASIAAIRKNIQAFNDNVKTFSEMNKKLVESTGSQVVFPQISPEIFKSAITEFKKIIGDIQVEHTPKSKRR
jgi:hypothetical protein